MRAVEIEQAHQAVLDEFTHAWGDKLRAMAEGTNPQGLINQAISPAGQARIRMVLGQERGDQFINNTLSMEARRQAMATPLAPAPQQAGAQFFRSMANRPEVQDAYRAAYGDVLRNAFSGDRNAASIRELLSNQGVRHILDVFGQERGGQFMQELLSQEARRLASSMPW